MVIYSLKPGRFTTRWRRKRIRGIAIYFAILILLG
jgi:hypothetical protein